MAMRQNVNSEMTLVEIVGSNLRRLIRPHEPLPRLKLFADLFVAK